MQGGQVNRRGAYFYVIDAFIASIIILSAVLILFSRYTSQQPSTQALYTGDDLLDTVSTTTAASYDDPQIRSWVASGAIPDAQTTLLEQLVRFKIGTGTCTGNAQTLAQLLGKTAPQQVGIEILVDGQSCYSAGTLAQAKAATMLSAKRIVLLRQNQTQLYPPSIVEVRTWQ